MTHSRDIMGIGGVEFASGAELARGAGHNVGDTWAQLGRMFKVLVSRYPMANRFRRILPMQPMRLRQSKGTRIPKRCCSPTDPKPTFKKKSCSIVVSVPPQYYTCMYARLIKLADRNMQINETITLPYSVFFFFSSAGSLRIFAPNVRGGGGKGGESGW